LIALRVLRQLTHAPYNHILTNANVWSHDGEWIVYDMRSDPAGSLFDGTRIERVHVETGEVEVLYASRRGACCGVATCSPTDDRVAFILGPEHPTTDWQYAAWHRQGNVLRANDPRTCWNLDARDVVAPFTPGALRGGSHVHVFSGDGQWVSFTYEDHVLETLSGKPAGADRNQRNVAVAAPAGPVRVPRTHSRNHDGEMFAAVVTATVNDPRPGSDEISRAYEDAWVGSAGYVRTDGSQQRRALAFLGDVTTADGGTIAELFVVDIPADPTRAGEGPLEGTPTRRPAPPAGTVQRRLTFTAARPYPGIAGPRHWPRSSPDGSQLAFLLRDDDGVSHLWTISPNGGEPRQLTVGPDAIASAFTWNQEGSRIAYIAGGAVRTVDTASGHVRELTPPAPPDEAPRPEACVFSPDGRRIAFVRSMAGPGGRFNQVFTADA
jgi:hypothetical protein